MIGPELVKQGDAILGLASTGIHSNGYSLVRAAVTDGVCDAELLEPRHDLGGLSLVDALLMPTRIYVRSVQAALASGAPIHALAHITGGGITENLNRALPEGLNAMVRPDSWDVPAIMQLVSRRAGLEPEQALRTFNMGIGMAVICDPADAEALSATFESAGEKVFRIGNIVEGTPGEAGKVLYGTTEEAAL